MASLEYPETLRLDIQRGLELQAAQIAREAYNAQISSAKARLYARAAEVFTLAEGVRNG